MASIWQRESGYWQADIRRKGHPRQSKTFRLRAEAEVWSRAVESEMDKGAFVSATRAERTTFADLAADFEREFAPHHYRGFAWQHKLQHLRQKLGPFSLTALTPQVVAKYRDERLAEPDPRYKDATTAPRLSPATVKSEIDLLSKILDVGGKEFGIALPAGNPVAGVRKPKGANARDRRLTAGEWEKLLTECCASGNAWLAPALSLAVETAMRQGELLGLDWKNVDRQRRLAMLPITKNGEARAVPLTSRALKVLETLPKAISGKVIPLERATLYKAFERACKRAGISDFTWHDLRHEALSRLAERGDLSVLEMAAVSGHKTLQMLKRYTHLNAERLAKKLG